MKMQISSDTVFITLFVGLALLVDMHVVHHAFAIPPIPDWVDVAMNTTRMVGATMYDKVYTPAVEVVLYPPFMVFMHMMSYFPFATMTAIACLSVV